MKRLNTPKKSYFRVEAILEAPMWALVVAILLMTVAVIATSIAQL